MKSGFSYADTGVPWTTVALAANAASVTITPTMGRQVLEIEFIKARSDQTGATSNNILMKVNADSGATYHFQQDAGLNNTAQNAEANSTVIGNHPTQDATDFSFGYFKITIPNYADTSSFKHWHCEYWYEKAGANAEYGDIRATRQIPSAGAGTDAITSVTISPGSGNWVTGSVYRFREVP